MAFKTNPPTIRFDQLEWDKIGTLDPAHRMLAHIRIGDLDMHLEAREVTIDRYGCQTTLEYPSDHGSMCEIADAVFKTTMIDGREYFLFALPFGD